MSMINDILHMSFLAGTHIFKAFPAYTTTEIRVRTKCSSICSVSVKLYRLVPSLRYEIKDK